MPTPAIVIAAFEEAPQKACGLCLSPLTIRRWFALDKVSSPFLAGDLPTDNADRLEATLQAVRILDADRFNFELEDLVETVEPSQIPALERAIQTVIARGFSTALAMRKPRKPGDKNSGSAPVDHFGEATRLLTYGVKFLGMDPDRALDMPLSQLFVLAATSEALDGKVPAAEDYFDRSQKQ